LLTKRALAFTDKRGRCPCDSPDPRRLSGRKTLDEKLRAMLKLGLDPPRTTMTDNDDADAGVEVDTASDATCLLRVVPRKCLLTLSNRNLPIASAPEQANVDVD
jgi:hypothetical protein